MELPAEILCLVPEDARPAVDRWWSNLTDVEREDVTNRWDERRETFILSPAPDETGRVDGWEQMPHVIGGQFARPNPDELPEWAAPEWAEEWFEHVVNHASIVMFPVFRTFHICQAEPDARAVTTAGLLPADFRCPINAAGCPMKRTQGIAPGKNLYLAPARAGGWWVVVPRGGEKLRLLQEDI